MVISYVVRLRPDALADGRFVGEIEAVTSRQRSSIRTIEQLAAFILATMPRQAEAVAAQRTASERAGDFDDPAFAGVAGDLGEAVGTDGPGRRLVR